MCAAPARVQWQTPPEGWLLPAAVVFDMAVRQCQPPEYENVVIHVQVVSETSALPRVKDDRHGTTSTVVKAPLIELVPEPMVFLVPSQITLDTAVGRWLSHRNLLTKCLCVLIGLCVLLLAWEPGQDTHEVIQKLPISVKNIKVTRPSAVTQVVRIVVMQFILFVWAHVCVRHMFTLTISYWEPRMIFVSSLICEVAKIVERFNMYPEPEELGGAYLAIDIAHCSLVAICHLAAGSLDSAVLPQNMKIAIASLFLISLMISYFFRFYVWKWSSTPECILTLCTTPGAVYNAASFNEMLFALKLLATLLLGYPYAVLTATFIHPTTTPYRMSLVTGWCQKFLHMLCFKVSTVPRGSRQTTVIGGVIPNYKKKEETTLDHNENVVRESLEQRSASRDSYCDSNGNDLVIAKEFPSNESETLVAFHVSKPRPASKNLFMDVLQEDPVRRPNSMMRTILS